MNTTATNTSYADATEGTSEIAKAIVIMRYWNQHNFEGRFKTSQTLWAESVLKQADIDFTSIGVPKKSSQQQNQQ